MSDTEFLQSIEDSKVKPIEIGGEYDIIGGNNNEIQRFNG